MSVQSDVQEDVVCFQTTMLLHPCESIPVSICCPTKLDPVVYAMMNEVYENLVRIRTTVILEASDVFFINEETYCAYTPASFSRDIYRSACKKLFDEYGALIGIELELVADIMSDSYENKRPKGILAFTRCQSDSVSHLLNTKFTYQNYGIFNSENKRFIRKLLEGAGDGILVLAYDDNKQEYCCLGYADRVHKSDFSCFFAALGRETWELYYASRQVFRSRMYNVMCLRDEVETCFCQLKAELGTESIDNLYNAIKAISRQMHGTSVVLVDLEQTAVKEHIEKLENARRALRVKDLFVKGGNKESEKTSENVRNKNGEDYLYPELTRITSMDGALILDYPRAEITHINVVVDGMAEYVQGDPSGGARKNSLTCFVANLIHECPNTKVAALIFSEDGGCKIVKGSDFLLGKP